MKRADTVNKYPFSMRRLIIVSEVNNLRIRPTDCSSTFDYMMHSLDYAVSLIRGLSSLEMFEVMIGLDKKGIENMDKHLMRKWDTSKVNTWDKRQIEGTLRYLKMSQTQ